MSKGRTVLQIVLVLAALGAGAGALAFMRATKPEAQREEKAAQSILVEVLTVRSAGHEVAVRAHGTVVPKTKVVAQSQISGRIVAQSPSLVPGGRVKKGEVLARIDPRDYQLALEARKAEVSRAKLELSLEEGRQEVASREWKMFGQITEKANDSENAEEQLALRGPQLRTAKVSVAAAQSALDRAKLDLTRTAVVAPFNALVLDEQVDVGQLVTPQSPLATLVGTDSYWVQVSVPVENLAFIAMPNVGTKTTGASAKIVQKTGSRRIERTGRVAQLLPDLDAGGAMARMLVEIDDPLGLKPGASSEQNAALPLLLNAYVDVEIAATAIDSAIEVPRAAVRDGDNVFVVDEQSRLRIRPVGIAWRRPDSVLVSSGLDDGAQVIVSPVAAPVDGMTVRAEQAGEAQNAPRAAANPEAPQAEADPVVDGQATP